MERIFRRLETAVGLHRCQGADQALHRLEEMQQHARPAGRVPALIVLDLNLPGRDGRYVLKQLRSRDAWKRIPVVIFSTSSSPQDIDWCYENGANAYHVKDLDYAVFKHAVEQLSSYWLKAARLPGSLEGFSAS